MNNTEMNIGVFAGRLTEQYRGIPLSTGHVVNEFNTSDAPENFYYLHYPDSPPPSEFDIAPEQLRELPFSGNDDPITRISQEQITLPVFLKANNLDVAWHPQNRGQSNSLTGYVCTLHDVLPLDRPDLSPDLADPDTQALFESRVKSIACADKIITVSGFSKERIVDNLGVNPDAVSVIPAGINHDKYNQLIPEHEVQRLRATYDLPEKYLMTLGGYSPHKNLPTLVQAYSQSVLPERGYGLVLAGPQSKVLFASDVERVKQTIDTYDARDKVTMLGSLPIDDLKVLYRGASMFAITSVYEGFGLPPVEAMACGVPTVVSNTTSLPEVCGDASLYADPETPESFSEQFNLLADNEHLQKYLAYRGLRRAQQFQWSKTAAQVLDVLREVGEPYRQQRLGKSCITAHIDLGSSVQAHG